MNKPHKHAELIKAWADGAVIEYKNGFGKWETCRPSWGESIEYRIKPEPKEYWLINPHNVAYGPYTKEDAIGSASPLTPWKLVKLVKANDED